MVKIESNIKKDFINTLKNNLPENNKINEFVSYIIQFENHVIVTSILALILFIYSVKTGAYYYIFKSLSNIISSNFSGHLSIIIFIIKIIVFYNLFNLILTTLLGLIFINKEDEKYSCDVKDLIDWCSDKISSWFFGLYIYFLIPNYVLNNLSSMYNTIIDNCKPYLGYYGWNENKLNKLNKSQNDLKKIQTLINKDIIEFYRLLNSYDSIISSFFKTLIKDIFLEESSNNLKQKVKNNLGIKNNINYEQYEDNTNITACSYSMNIMIYPIFIAIIYILLFKAFPETASIRIILFIIIVLILLWFLYSSISFKIAIGNFQFIKALNGLVIGELHRQITSNLKKESKEFIQDFETGFLSRIFGLLNEDKTDKSNTSQILENIRHSNVMSSTSSVEVDPSDWRTRY